jgi:alkylation response protein AidB-like acyl-CoA dehydrogenase
VERRQTATPGLGSGEDPAFRDRTGFSSTAEQERLYDEAREFAQQRVNPAAGQRGSVPYFSRQEWELCGELGLLGACIPERYGGQGHDALTVARIVEGFARGCADTGLVFSACAHLFACVMPIAEHGGDELKDLALPRLASGEWIGANAITEADAGSDVYALRCRAVRDGGRYLLTGTKTFVTNGPVADCLLVYASTQPTHGYLGITAFLVDGDSPGLVRGEHFDKIGLTGAPVCEVRLDECPVEESRRVGSEGGGAAVFRSSMDWERACLFAQYLGVMDRQLEEVVAFARRRRQFGRSLGRHQAIAHRAADMKLRLDAGRLLLHRACWMKSQGLDSTLEVSLAKLAISEAAVRSGLDAIQIFGSLGVRSDTHIASALCDALPSTIFSGTSEIQRDLIAHGLGL